jgi:hypothetical protein
MSDRAVRAAAAEALGANRRPPSRAPRSSKHWGIGVRCSPCGSGGVGQTRRPPSRAPRSSKRCGRIAGEDVRTQRSCRRSDTLCLICLQAVAQVAAQGAWGVLIRALTCTQVREVVVGLGAEALVKIGTQAVPALIQALGDRSENVRRAAAEALGANSATPKPCPRSSKHWGILFDRAADVRRASTGGGVSGGVGANSATPKPCPRSSKHWGMRLGAVLFAVRQRGRWEDTRRPRSRAPAHPSTGG